MFEILLNLDIISPLSSIINDFLRGPRCDFLIPNNYSVNEIKRLLKGHDIDFWGCYMRHDVIMLSIYHKDLQQVLHIFEIYGINATLTKTTDG